MMEILIWILGIMTILNIIGSVFNFVLIRNLSLDMFEIAKKIDEYQDNFEAIKKNARRK